MATYDLYTLREEVHYINIDTQGPIFGHKITHFAHSIILQGMVLTI